MSVLNTYPLKPGVWGSLILLSAILAFTPIGYFGFILVVALMSIYMPLPKAISTYILRFVISACLLACFIALIGIPLWLLNIPSTPGLIVILSLIPIIILILSPWANKDRFKLLNGSDITSLISTVCICGVIAIGAFHDTSLSELLRDITVGFDDTTHTSISSTVYDNQGYVYGLGGDNLSKLVYPELAGYQQGWYLSNTVVWHSINNHLSLTGSPQSFVLFYLITKLVWFGLMVFLFNRLILFLADKSIKGKIRIGHYVLSMALTLAACVLLLFGIYKFGFSSFMPLLVYLLGLGFFMSNGSEDNRNSFNTTVIFGLLLAGGVTTSWLLGGFIGYISVLLFIMAEFKYSVKQLFKWLFSSISYLILLIVVAGIGISQLAIQLLFSSVNNAAIINTDGGLWQISLLLSLLLLIYYVYTYISGHHKSINGLLYILLPSLILTGAIYLYQYASVGHASYYSTKTMYIPFLFLLVFGSVSLIAKISLAKKQGLLVILSLVALLIMPSLLQLDLSVTKQVVKAHSLSSETSAQIANIISDGQFRDNNIIVDKTMNYSEDIITTNFLFMLNRYRSTCDQLVFWYLLSSDPKLTDAIDKCADSKTITTYVIASSLNYSDLTQQLSSNPKVKVLLGN